MARLSERRRPGPTERATSCGGVILRRTDTGTQIIIGLRRREADRVTWSLPKGTPSSGESPEETALREVAEETGLDVRVVATVGPIRYFFTQQGRRIHKTVHYYLMEATGGDLSAHDHEFDEVRWLSVEEARELMSFSTEREIVEQALRVFEGVAR